MTAVRRSATVLLAVAGAVGAGGTALGEERVVEIGRDGVRPQVLQVEPGDTLRFVNDDPTFAYRAQSTGGPWRFDSGPTTLLDDDFVVPAALTRPGTYAYRVAQDAPFRGSVVVGSGAVPSTAPATPFSPGPAGAPFPPSATPAPVAAPAVPGPLRGSRSDRALGLAVAVAAVLVLGVASLLLRLLLALPAVPGPVLSDRTARLWPGRTGPPRW